MNIRDAILKRKSKSLTKISEPLPVIALCIIFTLIYLLFNLFAIAFNFLNSNRFDEMNLSDNGLLMLNILYCFLVFLLFWTFGYIVSRRTDTNRIKHFIIVLPVLLTGLTIWIIESIQQNVDMSMLFYNLYVVWIDFTINYLSDYVDNLKILKYVRFTALFIPSFSFLIGVWSNKFLAKYLSKKKMKLAMALTTLIIIICFLSTIWFPKSTLFTLSTYPKVDGATAAIPFGNVLINKLAGVSKHHANVNFNTSHEAYVNLIDKDADIIFVSGPSDAELELAKRKNVKLRLTPIGKDAFIFIVNNDNPINDLTIKQVQDIYSGKITNWKQVGGQDSEIMAFQREENSGSQTFMVKKVMQGIKLKKAPKEKVLISMGGLVDTVSEYKDAENSIGYSFYYYANEMHKRDNVKFLSINGVQCSKDNITSQKYPFTATLYAVTREDEVLSSSANKMLSWILSSEGKIAIEKGGFVPINN